MATPITVPRLGWSMEEAVFSSWLKGEGEMVRAGEMLFAIENDKAVQEVESFDAGVLHLPAIAPKHGDTVVVGQLIGYLLADGERAPASTAASNASTPPTPATRIAHASPASATTKTPVTPASTTAVISTPRARRAARELGVDWRQVAGSGRGGRIREADIRSAAASHAASASPAKRGVIAPSTIADQHQAAPLTLHATADATLLIRFCSDLAMAQHITGIVVPTCDELLVKFAAIALRKHPALNSRWENGKPAISPDIHISVAVESADGFRCPVIREVDRLLPRDVAIQCRELAERVRSRKVRADEMEDGTFTIFNLGAFGIDAFTPRINHPQCAALGIGRVLRQSSAVGDSAMPRDVVTLSLAFDPRVIDTALAARFIQTLGSLIESPLAAILS